MVWDIYDGPRTGLAEFEGATHYFRCRQESEWAEYSDLFELVPIGASILAPDLEQWRIYRAGNASFTLALRRWKQTPGTVMSTSATTSFKKSSIQSS